VTGLLDSTAIYNIAIAVLGGLAVGIERQWSGKADGPAARFAGLRTFTMLGLVAGLSGWLWTAGLTGPAIVLLAGLGALVVVAYLAASRADVDGTTEVSAFVVLAAGVLAGSGNPRIASGIIAITLLLLVEKKQLHALVKRMDAVEVRAGVRFAIMAAVILPLLPEGPFGPLGGIRPRALWGLVLFFSGLSFLGFVARRLAGPGRGYAVAGTIAGLVSSTSVTLTYSRLSAKHPPLGRALAAGVLGANAMLFPRVLVATLVLEPRLAAALWPALVAPAIAAGALMWTGLRSGAASAPDPQISRNPLQIGAALQMAALFQIVLFGVAWAAGAFGEQGLLGSAAVLGLTDADALTVSMARATTTGIAAADAAATAVTLGVLVNTLVKLVLAVTLGRGPFRPWAGTGLGLMAIALGAGLGLAVYFR
jgi:uncharacterized membrane protein (DUF4010 family)